MAEHGDKATGGGGGGTPGKTLDALSKEDLIKFSKKQAVSVSQMKAKLVDLQRSNASLTAEKRQWESVKGKLETEVVDLNRNSSRLGEENECLNQKLEGVTASYMALLDANDNGSASEDAKSQIKKLKAENQKLEDLLSDVSVSLDEVERDKQRISQEMADGRALLEDFQKQNGALKESVRRAMEDGEIVKELRSELEAKSSEMEELKTSLDRLESLKVSMDGEVDSWKRSFEECQLSLESLRDRNVALEEEKASALREVAIREVKIGELGEEKTALEEENTALAEKEAKLKTVAQKMKAELLRRREEDRNRSEDSLNLSSLKQSNLEAEKDDHISSLQKEICDLKENLLSMEEALRVQGLENGELSFEIVGLKAEVDDASHSKQILMEEASGFQSELEALRSTKDDLERQTDSLEKEKVELNRAVETLERDKSDIKDDCKKVKDSNNSLEEEKEELNRAIETLERDKTDIKENLDASLKEKSAELLSLKETNQNLNKDKVALEGRIEELEVVRQISDSERGQSESSNELQSEVDRLRYQLAETSCELESKRSENKSLLSRMKESDDEKSSAGVGEMTDVNGENLKLVRENSDLRSLLDRKAVEIETMGEMMKSEGKNVSDLQEKLREKADEMGSLEDQLKSGEIHEAELTARIEDLKRDTQERDEKLDLIESEVQELQRDNSQLKAVSEELTEKSALLEKLLAQKDEGDKVATEERDQFKTYVGTLEKMLEEKEKGNEVAMEEREQLKANVVALEKILDEKDKGKEKAMEEREQFKANIMVLEKLLAERDKGNEAVEEEREQFKADIMVLEKLLAEKDKGNEAVEEERDQFKADIMVLEKLLAEKDKGNEVVEEEREQFKANIIVKEEKLRQMEKEGEEREAEFKSQIHQLEEEGKAATAKYAALTKSLEEEKSRHKSTYAKLENLKKTAQKKSVMHLEISDYEKTVDQLNRTVEEREREKSELREEIRHRDEKIEALTSEKTNVEIQREEETQRAEMIKTNLEKMKSELESARDADRHYQLREIETEQRTETLRREIEIAKVAMAESAAVSKRNEDDLSRKLEEEKRAYKSLQSKYELVEDELQHSQLEVVAVKEEMSNYKAKAQAVLKQARSESQSKEASRLAQAEVESLKQKASDLESEVDSLQTEIRETIDESDNVKSERDNLKRAHADVMRQLNTAEERYRSASKEWERENRACKDNYESSVQSLTERQTSLIESHRDKLVVAQEEFAAQLTALQRVADSNEQEVFRLQKELQIALAIPSSESQHLHQGGGVTGGTVGGNGASQSLMTSSLIVDGENGGAFISSIERQEGEGMEHTDTSECEASPTPSQVGPHQSFMTFDQLLSSPNVNVDSASSLPVQKLVWPTEEVTLKTLHDELSTASRKVAHLTELMRESEASNARLAEESKILKEEIRRSERNTNRQMELDNLEYLKNVIFKFLSFESDAEARTRLVPVMTMLLKLSPEEKQMLASVATGEVPAAGALMQANAAEGGGWSAYLHRWSGLM